MMLISVITGVEMKYPDEQTVIDAFTETDRLLKWGFDNYTSHKVVTEGEKLRDITVDKGEPATISGVCADTIYATLEKGVPTETVQVTTALRDEKITAPVSSGDVLGSVSLMMDGKVIATTELLAGADAQLKAKEFKPNVPLIIILSIMVAAGAAFLVYYTNNKGILLLDLAREKLGIAAGTSPSVRTQPVRQEETRTPKKENAVTNLFDDYFSHSDRK